MVAEEFGHGGGMLELKIKTLATAEGIDLIVRCPAGATVAELKRRVQERTSIAEDSQRLIYRGRLMEDAQLLSSYSVQNEHTIHCVPRPSHVTAIPATASEQTTDIPGADTGPAPGAAARRLVMGSLSFPPPSFMRDTARLLSNAMRAGPEGGMAAPAQADTAGAGEGPVGAQRVGDRDGRAIESGSIEHIRQGLMTLHTVMSGMAAPASQSYSSGSEDATSPMDEEEHVVLEEGDGSAQVALHGRSERTAHSFWIGQWVDVLDTVNQWLEATVIDINYEANTLKITYNGWPSRWDEWIPCGSPRISPFRTRTMHSAFAPYMSPSPLAERLNRGGPPVGITDPRQVIPDVLTVVRRMEAYLTDLSEVCEESLASDAQSSSATVRAAEEQGGESLQERPACILGTLPWERERKDGRVKRGRRRRRPEEAEPQGDEGADRRPKRSMREVAADVAPLLDRCGRLLADLAPHVAALGRHPDAAATLSAPSTSASAVASQPAGSSAAGSTSGSGTGTGRRAGRASTRERGDSARTRSSSPDSSYRMLVATPNRPGPGLPMPPGIDIHVHAFITPVRPGGGRAATQASPSPATQDAGPQTRSGSSGAAQISAGTAGAAPLTAASLVDRVFADILGAGLVGTTQSSQPRQQEQQQQDILSNGSLPPRPPSTAPRLSSAPAPALAPPQPSLATGQNPAVNNNTSSINYARSAAGGATPAAPSVGPDASAFYGLMSSSLLAASASTAANAVRAGGAEGESVVAEQQQQQQSSPQMNALGVVEASGGMGESEGVEGEEEEDDASDASMRALAGAEPQREAERDTRSERCVVS